VWLEGFAGPLGKVWRLIAEPEEDSWRMGTCGEFKFFAGRKPALGPRAVGRGLIPTNSNYGILVVALRPISRLRKPAECPGTPPVRILIAIVLEKASKLGDRYNIAADGKRSPHWFVR
jgi:hypothetical protein